MIHPMVSVIVPAYNEEKVIKNLLSSIKRQSYKNIEIIVVDDNSMDNTPLVARKFTNRVYVREHAERSIQRNFGAKKSLGDFLFFLDADMELTQNVVYECVKVASEDINIGGIIVPEVSKARSFWEKVKAYERSFYNSEGDDVTDAARFFSKKAFEKVGGYDETITGPEDWDLPESIKKSGYRIERVTSVIVHHERIPSLYSLVRKKYYYALKSHKYIKKQKMSLFSPKTIYFLRPIFYKNWRKLIASPILSGAMFTMFFFELMGGGLGYLVGKYLKK